MYKLAAIFILIFTVNHSYTQTLEGQIIDSDKEGIPFVSVKLLGSGKKSATDLDGNFVLQLKNEELSDTVMFSALSYNTLKIPVSKIISSKEAIFTLEEEGIELENVEIDFGEDPAVALINQAVRNRNKNSPKNTKAINYKKYSRLEVDLNNITEEAKQKRALRKIADDLEKIALPRDTSGNEYIPMFISETYAHVYQKFNPQKYKEVTLAMQLHGVGVSDAQYWTQFSSANFTDLNFYKDIISIIDKDFHSPLSSNWDGYYDVYLMDSSIVNGQKVYEIDIEPKRKSDLAFRGTIWLFDQSYALQHVRLSLLKTANINFVDNIGLDFIWTPTDSSRFWLKSSEIEFDLDELDQKGVGIKGNFFTENSEITYSAPDVNKFYTVSRDVSADANFKDSTYWSGVRPSEDSSSSHVTSLAAIQEIKDLPSVKSYTDIIQFVANGHLNLGKIELGPVTSTYAYNDIEQHRFRLGGRTNINFSKKMQLSGYAAYGTKDEVWKYQLKVKMMLSRKHWTTLSIRHRKELDILGITGFFDSPFFNFLTKWGNQVGSFYYQGTDINLFRQWNRSFSTNIKAVNYTMDPTFEFTHTPSGVEQIDKIQTSELGINVHFGFQEKFIIDDFNRRSLRSKIPIFDFNYILGLSDVFGSQYNYHKLSGKISHYFPLGRLGKSDITLQGGLIINPLPYPLLNIAIGNQTIFYADFAFNVMNYFEFISDKHASLSYVHHFNGYILNRVPLMKKLKWRTVVNFAVLKGSVSQENLDLIEPDQQTFTTFEQAPYMEVGYGIENIFKVLRVQAFHRLTYRENQNAQNFGVKMTFQLSF